MERVKGEGEGERIGINNRNEIIEEEKREDRKAEEIERTRKKGEGTKKRKKTGQPKK